MMLIDQIETNFTVRKTMVQVTPEEIKKEWDATRSQMYVLGMSAFALLSVGATFFHFSQKLSWIDAYYFCTITLTTVGYGDFVPETSGQKLFIMFYILIGIGLVATFANVLIKSTGLRREYKRAKNLRDKTKS